MKYTILLITLLVFTSSIHGQTYHSTKSNQQKFYAEDVEVNRKVSFVKDSIIITNWHLDQPLKMEIVGLEQKQFRNITCQHYYGTANDLFYTVVIAEPYGYILVVENTDYSRMPTLIYIDRSKRI